MSNLLTRRRDRHLAARVASAFLAVAALGMWFALASTASATTIAYSGSTTGAQSSVTIHRGDQYQRVINPDATLTAVLDDTNHKVVSGQTTFRPSYTPTFTGPFNILVYVRTDLEQVGAITGTANPGAVSGTTDVQAAATTRLRVTVYVTKDGSQHPDTDNKLSTPDKCFVDLPLVLKGSANRRTGTLQLKQDPFTIPAFPDGKADPNLTCGFATGSLNQQVAGANNGIDLNFTGGPTSAHYTGVTKGAQSTIVIKKGTPVLERTVNPTGSIVSDIDFVTGKVTNTAVKLDPVTMRALPGILQSAPVDARIDLSTIGTPTVTLSPSGTPGVDNVKVQTTNRMAVTITALNNPNFKLTDPAKCYVDLKLDLAGTVDRGTDQLKLGPSNFAIPSFPWGCGLLLAPGLTAMVSGPQNTIALNFVDG